MLEHPLFRNLDHIAILVRSTDEALKTWRDRLGLPVLFSEVVNDGTIRLTHLDLGNTQLQLVEPLTETHPLRAWLDQHGPGLHHLCLGVDDVESAHTALPSMGVATAAKSHQGTRGKKALFLNPESTMGVPLEITGS
jgi:methylmalonyl-CoA/ethylmalonyl-CoA epimerase